MLGALRTLAQEPVAAAPDQGAPAASDVVARLRAEQGAADRGQDDRRQRQVHRMRPGGAQEPGGEQQRVTGQEEADEQPRLGEQSEEDAERTRGWPAADVELSGLSAPTRCAPPWDSIAACLLPGPPGRLTMAGVSAGLPAPDRPAPWAVGAATTHNGGPQCRPPSKIWLRNAEQRSAPGVPRARKGLLNGTLPGFRAPGGPGPGPRLSRRRAGGAREMTRPRLNFG